MQRNTSTRLHSPLWTVSIQSYAIRALGFVDHKDFTAEYLDLVIYSESWEEQLQHKRNALHKSQEAGLTAYSQSNATAQWTYLGHIVGGGRVHPEADKLEAAKCFPWPVPTTKKQASSFVGPHGILPSVHATRCLYVPLTDLTMKWAPNQVQWNSDCARVSEELLCSTPVLWSPDFSKEFVVQTDALDLGVGAVLWSILFANCYQENNATPLSRRSTQALVPMA